MATIENKGDGTNNQGSRKKLPFKKRFHPSSSTTEENTEVMVSKIAEDPVLDSTSLVGYVKEEYKNGYSFSINIKGTDMIGIVMNDWPPLSAGTPKPAPKPRARRASKKVEQKPSGKSK